MKITSIVFQTQEDINRYVKENKIKQKDVISITNVFRGHDSIGMVQSYNVLWYWEASK